MKLGNLTEYLPNAKSTAKVAVSLVLIATAVGVVGMFVPSVAQAARKAMSEGLTGLLPKSGQ